MTEQEINKLREKLGSDYSVKIEGDLVAVELVDIWKGVEFAIADHTGIIYKIDRFETSPMKKIWFSHGKFLFPEKCKPSTEAAYVEQLKAKAHELYGEIKDGDRFEFTWIGNGDALCIHLRGKCDFYYDTESDTLDLNGFPIYKQGKWAKKLPQCIVTPIEIHSAEPDIVGNQFLSIQMKIIHRHISQKNRKDVAYHLAKCLEDYLNKSQ